jgi:hypothetical protein
MERTVARAWLTLERPAVRVVVAPEMGGRIVSLQDRRTGREWLAQGSLPGPTERASWSGEEARYGGPQAFGWDECLPTVAASPDPTDAAGAPLRDHGDCWGRDALCTTDGQSLLTRWPPGRWGLALQRRLRLDSSAVILEYVLQNHGSHEAPFLWAAHPLLTLEPATRLHLPRIDRVRVHTAIGANLPGRRASWPRANVGDGTTLDLDVIPDAESRMALKLFALGLPGRAGALAPDGSWVGVAWDPTFAPALGVWLDHGGWPQPGPRHPTGAGPSTAPELAPLHQVALEPATAAFDSLADAVAAGQAARIGPGRSVRWWMRAEVGTQPPGLAAFLHT